MVEIGIVIDLWGLKDITSFWIQDPILGFKNFTENLAAYSCQKQRNKLSNASFSLFSVGDEEKEWIKQGNLFFFFSENKLFLKGRISLLDIDSFNVASIQGLGIAAKGRDEVTGRSDFNYVQTASDTIINNLASGIFIVGTNNNFGLIDVRFEYENRLSAIMAIAESTNYEWRVRNIVDNGYDTNYLDFGLSLGSSSSVYQFNISGTNQNIISSKKQKDIESVVNKIIILGAGDGINQLTSINYHATTNRTNLNGGDTFLSADLNTIETTATVFSTSGFPSSGTIRIDNEQITYSSKTDTTFDGLTRAANSTSTSSHFTNSGVIGYTSLTVDSTALFGATGSIRIGNEVVAYTGITATTFTGITRGSSSTTPYAHIDNIEVYDNQYTATTDGSQTGSSIKDNGVLIGSHTDKTLIDQNTLDLVAQWTIQDRKDIIERITLSPIDFREVINFVDVLDTVTVTDSETGLSGTYKVVGMTLSLNNSGAEGLAINLTNSSSAFLDTESESSKSIQIMGQYMQGATNVDSNSIVDDIADTYASATDPNNTGAADLFFNISEDAKQINSIKLSYRLQAGSSPYSATLIKILTTNNAEGVITWSDNTLQIETDLGRVLNVEQNTSETDIDLTTYFSATGWKAIRIVANGNARVFASITQKIYIHS